MKKILLSIFTVILLDAVSQAPAGNLVTENIPEIPPALMEQMTQYQNTRSAALLDFHPGSGKLLISTRFAETPQLHTLSQPLGARTQLTFFKEPVTYGSYCPDVKYN